MKIPSYASSAWFFDIPTLPGYGYMCIRINAGYRQSTSREDYKTAYLTLLYFPTAKVYPSPIESHAYLCIESGPSRCNKVNERSAHHSAVTSRINYSKTFYSSPSRSSCVRLGYQSAGGRSTSGPSSPTATSGRSCRPCPSSRCARTRVASVRRRARLLGCLEGTPRSWATTGTGARGASGCRARRRCGAAWLGGNHRTCPSTGGPTPAQSAPRQP